MSIIHLLGDTGQQEESTVYELWLVAGQSNTDGRVPMSSSDAPDWIHDGLIDGVKVWNGSEIVDYDLGNNGQDGNGSSWTVNASENNFSWIHITTKLLADTGKQILICQVTEGGTSITELENYRGTWSTNYDNKLYPEIPYLLEDLKNRYLALIAYLDNNNMSYSLKGILWHQGESDYTSLVYYSLFSGLIADIRSWTGRPTLPIIYGTIPHASGQYGEDVETDQLQIASEDANAYCRDNSTLTLLDAYHFDSLSTQLFGQWGFGKAFNL